MRTRIAATIAVAGVFALVAAPAFAAPPALPPGDALYNIPCDGTLPPLQLQRVDPATAVTSGFGPGLAGVACSYDAAWNPVTGKGYGVENDAVDQLLEYDMATGSVTRIGPLLAGGSQVDSGALTIGLDGVAWYLVNTGNLYTLDLGSGSLTLAGPVSGLTDSVWASATDPATGTLYALQRDGRLVTLDPGLLSATEVAMLPLPSGVAFLFGLTVDSAGTAWIIASPSGGGTGPSGLYSTPLATPGVLTYSGEYTSTATSATFYSFIIFSTWAVADDEGELADTGAATTPLANASAALILAGLASLMMRRRVSAA